MDPTQAAAAADTKGENTQGQSRKELPKGLIPSKEPESTDPAQAAIAAETKEQLTRNLKQSNALSMEGHPRLQSTKGHQQHLQQQLAKELQADQKGIPNPPAALT